MHIYARIGIGECYEAFSHIFGPIFNQLHAYQQLSLPITSNNLAYHPSSSPMPTLPPHLTKQDTIRGISSFNNYIAIDATNTFVSTSCLNCKSICRHYLIPIPTSTDTCSPFTHPPTSTDIFTAGDMKTMRTLLGIQAANSHCFCPICLVTKHDIPLGKVHTPFTLNKYKSYDHPTINHIFTNRTNTSQHNHHQSFVNHGYGDKSKAKHHANVINPPLISSSFENHIAPFPLHIRLGVTKKALDIIQAQCIQLDMQAKQANGKTMILIHTYHIYMFILLYSLCVSLYTLTVSKLNT
jgi:hypothetical protein